MIGPQHLSAMAKFCFNYQERERERERQRQAVGEKQSPCLEPAAGLDPRTPGSHPRPKAGAELLSHPGIPIFFFFFKNILFIYS